jgi:hypothetical protein
MMMIITAIIKIVNYSTHPAYIVTQSLHHFSLSTQNFHNLLFSWQILCRNEAVLVCYVWWAVLASE